MQKDFGYRFLRGYAGFLLRHYFFSSIEVEGMGHVPDSGVPVLLVGNHQNGLMDPLLTICTLNDRKVHVFTRGAVFTRGGLTGRCAKKFGMIPAYRLDKEGMDMVAQNKVIMHDAGMMMADGATLLIYPEGIHSERCHLGGFSPAYLRMAFDAASSAEFGKEINVVPVGVHYDNFYGLRNRALLRFGHPIPLSCWYARFQEKPRTTCRELNISVREAVKRLVLDIPEEHYAMLEQLCESRNTDDSERPFACKRRMPLSEQLSHDQAVMRKLDGTDGASRLEFINDAARQKAVSGSRNQAEAGRLIFDVILLPFGIASLWPGIVAWQLGESLAKKSGTPCFANLYLLALGGLFVMPLLCMATFVLIGVSAGWTAASAWLALQPLTCLFAWYYWREISYMKKKREKNKTR